MLERTELEKTVKHALSRSRGVMLVGPRQAGKSTLAQRFLDRDSPNYFDLEYPPHAQRLTQATGVLEGLQGRVVIDEIQRKPELFPLLRVLMDRSNAPGQFLLLGSASPSLLRQAGESLLGRIETVEVGGFDLQEACVQDGAWNATAAQNLWRGLAIATSTLFSVTLLSPFAKLQPCSFIAAQSQVVMTGELGPGVSHVLCLFKAHPTHTPCCVSRLVRSDLASF